MIDLTWNRSWITLTDQQDVPVLDALCDPDTSGDSIALGLGKQTEFDRRKKKK